MKGAGCSDLTAAEVTILYTVNGTQRNTASFEVFGRWEYNGASFEGSEPVTVEIPLRENGTPTTYPVKLSVSDPTGTGIGSSSFVVTPFNLKTTGNNQSERLDVDAAKSSATVHVTFASCAVPNTPPALTLPGAITAEATSSAGAVVEFEVPAIDAEDGDLTEAVVCTANGTTVRSGDTFPLGETTVECEVTDKGGLSDSGSFKITVVDTTPPVFTNFPGSQTLVAANINGAVLDIAALGITAEDKGPNGEPGNISEPVTWTCDYVADTWLAIGSTTTVACTAKDGRNNMSTSTFEVFVTLDFSPTNPFDSPLRMSAPFSAHKAGSAIPHKFAAPRYADGSPATDLAGGLRLTLSRNDGKEIYEQDPEEDYGAGSTMWRYSKPHYIFNLKTEKGWGAGEWTTTVSYAGITLASTTFSLRN